MTKIKYYWGCPDEVSYIDDKGYRYDLDYSVNGYTFGIWGGVLVCGNDDDETATMTHSSLILYYVYYNGWPSNGVGGDILPVCEVSPGCEISFNSFYELPVVYEDDDEFKESGYRRFTYGDLIVDLGFPVCRGRILYDFNHNISFIGIWDDFNELDKNNLIKVGKYFGGLALNSYFIIFSKRE